MNIEVDDKVIAEKLKEEVEKITSNKTLMSLLNDDWDLKKGDAPTMDLKFGKINVIALDPCCILGYTPERFTMSGDTGTKKAENLQVGLSGEMLKKAIVALGDDYIVMISSEKDYPVLVSSEKGTIVIAPRVAD